MLTTAMEWVNDTGFVTWQTPVSFLAGVGAHHLYCKVWRDREKSVQEED